MGVRFTDQSHVALYDSVTDTAFGPLFKTWTEAEDFLAWFDDKVAYRQFEGRVFRDVREVSPFLLELMQVMFRKDKGTEEV